VTPAFRRGDLRLFLLGALEDGPRHGYELMRVLEERSAGLYRPSAGSIYPRLNTLVDAGLVSQSGHDYSLTDAGRAEVDARRRELRDLDRQIAGSTRRAGHAVRAEVRAAAAEVRSQQRRLHRQPQRPDKGAALRALNVELRVFAADVMAAARRTELDGPAVGRVLEVLDESRAAALIALAASVDNPGPHS
jgi:DNA-binding PadR family transcriptional regulator